MLSFLQLKCGPGSFIVEGNIKKKTTKKTRCNKQEALRKIKGNKENEIKKKQRPIISKIIFNRK